MTDTLHRSGGAPPTNLIAANSYNPIVGGTVDHPAEFPIGTPVVQSTSDAGTVIPGIADDSDTSFVIGMAAGRAVVGGEVIVQLDGPIHLTTAQWDAITGGSGGLVAGDRYFLSAADEGMMTTTAPSSGGQLVVSLGVALSSTDFLIKIGDPAAVGSSAQSSFAMFYGTTNGTGNQGNLYGAPFAPGEAISFALDGPSSGALISRSGIAFTEWTVSAAGFYDVSWAVAFTAKSQLELRVNDVAANNTCALSGAAGGINTNAVVLSLIPGDRISLVNPIGNTASLTVQADDVVLTHAQAPNLVIKFLGAS